MSTPSDALSPQARLAASRKAIVRHMKRDHRKDLHDDRAPGLEYALDADDGQAYDAYGGVGQDDGSGSRLSAALHLVKYAVRSWWHHHPVNVAYDFARPVVHRFAANEPYKLLGIAAGVGAAAVLIRPWRLVSLGGVALAALKSSEFSSLALSMLSSSRSDPHDQKTTR